MSKKSTQLKFAQKEFANLNSSFGGSLTEKSNPKTKRPLNSKRPIHLVLKANRSVLRLPKTYGRVSTLLSQKAQKYGVKIFKEANVGNHIHLVVQITNRRLWNGFIRDFTSRLAVEFRQMGVIVKSHKLWKHRPFTRIVEGWNKAFKSVINYVFLNQLEAEGKIDRKKIKTYKDLKLLWREHEGAPPLLAP